MIRSLVLVLALVLSGCSAKPKLDSTAASPPAPTRESAAAAISTSGPNDIVEIGQLTDQREVWDCPKCGMVFDRAGMCTMCSVELVHTQVDYTCAADGKPVERAGVCPRCAVPVRVSKTVLASAAAAAPALGGK